MWVLHLYLSERRKDMNKYDTKAIAKAVIKGIGAVGAVKIVHNLTPYEGVFGTIACGTFTFFAAMAAQDMIESQLLKCEAVLHNMSNGADFVVF